MKKEFIEFMMKRDFVRMGHFCQYNTIEAYSNDVIGLLQEMGNAIHRESYDVSLILEDEDHAIVEIGNWIFKIDKRLDSFDRLLLSAVGKKMLMKEVANEIIELLEQSQSEPLLEGA